MLYYVILRMKIRYKLKSYIIWLLNTKKFNVYNEKSLRKSEKSSKKRKTRRWKFLTLEIKFLLLHLRCSSPVPGFPCTPLRFSSARNLQHKKRTTIRLCDRPGRYSSRGNRNNQNFRPELFRRGWRRRYFNPARCHGRGRKVENESKCGGECRDSLKQRVTRLVAARPRPHRGVTFLPKARESSRKLTTRKQMLLRRGRSRKFPRKAETFPVKTFPATISYLLALSLSDFRSTQEDSTLLLNELADFASV